MGYSNYDYSSRSLRSASSGYQTKSVDQLFEQNSKKEIHATLDPNGVSFRECRDSATHPASLPIILGLDVTGSMRRIPHMLIKDGLPTMVSRLHEAKLNDASLCFIAIGDHKNDSAPLQISQFESGDEELDTHLTRTWLEGGGGGNGGESYMIAWYFAAFHTKTDQWEKRHKKGFLITVGDEPCHSHLPANAIREMFGDAAVGGEGYTSEELLKKAQEKWNVYHINTNGSTMCIPGWKELLGECLIDEPDYTKIPEVISNIIAMYADSSNKTVTSTEASPIKDETHPEPQGDIIL